ncbi:hypothetical protein AB0D15_40070, partial [Streptomyces sp. NPDC048551]
MNPLPSPWPLPLSTLYTGGVQLGSHALERLAPAERERVLRACSTNVDNLDSGRWETLLTSACVLEEPIGSLGDLPFENARQAPHEPVLARKGRDGA